MQCLNISVSSSFGVAQSHSENDNIDKLINRADQALYKAKESGHNRVIAINDKG